MDDIKLFAKNEKELETVRIYSQYIGIEFGIEKCAMILMKSGKQHLTDGLELPNQDKIRKEHLRRTRKLLETKLCSKNLIKRIDTLAVSLVRYSRPFLKWTREVSKRNKEQEN